MSRIDGSYALANQEWWSQLSVSSPLQKLVTCGEPLDGASDKTGTADDTNPRHDGGSGHVLSESDAEQGIVRSTVMLYFLLA